MIDECEIINLFNVMKRTFGCEQLTLKTYTDAYSNVSYAFSRNTDDFVKREAERRAVACICNNVVKVNFTVAQKLSFEYIEEVLIHEITHYLLVPKDTLDHPQFFWDEFKNNCKIWKRKRREYDT